MRMAKDIPPLPSFLCDNINKFFNCLEISDEFVKKSLS